MFEIIKTLYNFELYSKTSFNQNEVGRSIGTLHGPVFKMNQHSRKKMNISVNVQSFYTLILELNYKIWIKYKKSGTKNRLKNIFFVL